MRVWLYYRLSRDEDIALNSLTNQRKILEDYATTNGYEIVGESFDDNVSGMHFNREGIDKITDAVENRLVDAIIVKDLSRLGRHRTQTAMFIDFLRENDVKVLSVTESIDTSNEDDDLIIGFKGVLNDFYARDVSKKIRAGYTQKQKSGIVMIPPFGYFKDKNTNEVIIVEESAEIVRRIFDMYINGYGLKAIAKTLNAEEVKSPGYYQKKLLSKNLGYNKPEIAHRFLWENTGIKRILQNEFYIGTLICHKSYTNKINKVRKELPPSEHFRHENFVPAIINKEQWEQAQFLLKDKPERNVRASSGKPCHRYAGLLKCADCGSTFASKKREWADKPTRVEYNCNGYHRYGVEHCNSHKIDESKLDELIYAELIEMKRYCQQNWKSVESDVKKWISGKNNADKKLAQLEEQIKQRSNDLEGILLERIHDKEHASIYTKMIEKCEADIQKCKETIANIKDYEQTIKKRKAEIKANIDLLDEIVATGSVSDLHLRMLVDCIVIADVNGKLQIEICMKAQFRQHVDSYDDDGNLCDRSLEMMWDIKDSGDNQMWWQKDA